MQAAEVRAAEEAEGAAAADQKAALATQEAGKAEVCTVIMGVGRERRRRAMR